MDCTTEAILSDPDYAVMVSPCALHDALLGTLEGMQNIGLACCVGQAHSLAYLPRYYT